MKSVALLILNLMIFSFSGLAVGQEGDTAPTTDTPPAPFSDLNTKGDYKGAPLGALQQILTYSVNSKGLLFKPDLKKETSSFNHKPLKVFNGKRKGRALLNCNMSWQKMTKLSDIEKANYQSGPDKSAAFSTNAPVNTPNKTTGIPEPKGTVRDLTATFKVKIDNDYFDGLLTCKIHEYLVKGKLQPLSNAEILKALEKIGFKK